MLARHLNKQRETPVRYALDPAHARAATDLGNESQRVLQGVHPLLWHYGEHGEFPQ